jgi:hypothetical protein
MKLDSRTGIVNKAGAVLFELELATRCAVIGLGLCRHREHPWQLLELSAAAFDNIIQRFSLLVENSLVWRFCGRGIARLGFDDGASSLDPLFGSTGEIVPVKPNQKSDGPTEQRHAGVDQKELQPAPLTVVSPG